MWQTPSTGLRHLFLEEGCRKAVLGIWAKLQAAVYDILLVEERCRKARLGMWAKLQALAYDIFPLVGMVPESAALNGLRHPFSKMKEDAGKRCRSVSVGLW